MQGFGLQFDHFGLATSDADKTLSFLGALGYQVPEAVHDPLQRVNLVFCTHPEMPSVEVIYATGEEGPLQAILSHQPQSIYHLCFRSRDAASSLAEMKEAGYRSLVVSPAKPAVLFDSLCVSFHMVHGFGLIEIIEDPL